MGADIDAIEAIARKQLNPPTTTGGGREVTLRPSEHKIPRYNDVDMVVRFRKSRTEPLRWEMQEVYYLVSTGEVTEIATVPTRIDEIAARITPHAKKFIENWNNAHPERKVFIESFDGVEKISVEDVKNFIEQRDGKQ